MILKIRNYIFTGLLVTVPLVVSIVITVWIFKIVTSGIINILPVFFKENLGWQIAVRLVTPIVILIVLAIIGIVAKIVFIKKVFGLGEKILIKIPLFNKIYVGVKQISRALFTPGSTMFKRVVLVEFPRPGIYAVGFITGKSNGEIETRIKGELLHIFVPTTPNPTSGFLLFARPHEIKELGMSVEEGMKLVISGGILTPNATK